MIHSKIKKNAESALSKAKRIETTSDEMQEQISSYLAECTKHELSLESSRGASAMMRIVNELESIGDSSFNLFLQVERLKSDLEFDNDMDSQVLELHELVMEFINWNHSFITKNIEPMTSQNLDKSIKYENRIDDMRNKFLDISRNRISKGSNPKAELLFMDIIKHLEHIGDYSLNISQALEQAN